MSHNIFTAPWGARFAVSGLRRHYTDLLLFFFSAIPTTPKPISQFNLSLTIRPPFSTGGSPPYTAPPPPLRCSLLEGSGYAVLI